jgi:hypothetical protein
MKTWLLALSICIGGLSNEASAATEYRAGWSAHHLISTRPMGFFIAPDAVVRIIWKYWVSPRTFDTRDKEYQLKYCRRCWAYPAEDENK